MQHIVILGTGLAGYTLAREIRKRDDGVRLTLITGDGGEAYAKPMLSTALAQGKTPDLLVSATADRMGRQLDARILTHTRITGIDSAGRRVLFAGGEETYDRLVLALGAHPIRPPMGGDAADRVLSVNGLADYRRFREGLESARRVAIIGPGLIGCEFASDLLGSGRRVDLIGPDPHPISTLLPKAAGELLRSALTAAGATWHLGVTADAVFREDGHLRLELSDGRSLLTDRVVSAIGLRPAVELAREAGLEIARGIVTDRYLETSVPGIHALGDCAEVAGHNLPFVQPLMQGARALAATLTGEPTPVSYPAMPVVIKTAQHPVVVAPPPRQATGNWRIEALDNGVRALFRSPGGKLLGFAITGDAVVERQALTRQLPPLL